MKVGGDGDAGYEKALNVCERMLAFEMDDLQRSNIQRKMGDICLEIFGHDKNPETCERAIQAYKKALLVYTSERYPNPRARVLRSLGFAFAARADLEDRIENLKRAINSWQESLCVFSEASAPEEYASLQVELGSAYRKLAECENRLGNGNRSIQACQNALRIYDLKDRPLEFAKVMTKLGSAYLTLAQFVNRADNCKHAIMSYQEALQVYDSVLQKGGDAFDMESTAAVLTALGRLEEALNCLYLAREAMPMDRFEDEIGMIQDRISARNDPDTQRKE